MSPLARLAAKDEYDFSLILGGPFFQMLRRAHLTGDALQLARQRIVAITAFTWLPLLLLAAIEGKLLGGASVPFLLDADVHVRFLVALPLLIGAEILVHQRMRPVIQQFLERKLVPEDQMDRFEAALASAMRLRNSALAEAILIAIVYGFGILVFWRQFGALYATTWYATPEPDGATFSLAGIWFVFVAVPIFQFLLVRWYFRIFIWTRFLWHVSKIRLHIVPTHPDHLGGLAFLSSAMYSFSILAAAHGALLAGLLANRIFHLKAGLLDFKPEIAVLVVFVLFISLGPLFVLSGPLARAKRIGLREYGALAQRYVREFDAKWLRGGAPPDEPFVGSGDIQSLADLNNGFDVVRSMRIVPVTRDDVLRLVVATLIPVAPLALTIMPFEDLMKLLLGVLF